MKLYTDEQVSNLIQAIYPQISREEFYKLIQALTPIELPIDEDIDDKIEYSSYSLEYDTGFRFGAKWVIEQIKQQATT